MKIAYASPLPPDRTGVADYSVLLLPALRRRVDVRVLRRGAKRVPRGTDVALCHMGNEVDAHGWILQLLRRRPGVVVLHDFVLHHLIAGLTVGQGDGAGYLHALERDGGPTARLLGLGVLDGSVPPLWETSPDAFPLVDEVLDLAEGLIVHSHYVERLVRGRGYNGPIWRIPHPAWPAPAPRERERADARFVVGCFGNLNASKRVPQLLAAFGRLRENLGAAQLVLAGSVAPGVELEERAAALGLQPGHDVLHVGYLTEDRLWDLVAGSDVCVSLRAPTMGETSGMAIRALSAGKPLVVSDVGWFSELPDGVAVKVPVDEHEVPFLAAALRLLADDARLRARMGAAARAYVEREHDLERAAELYVAALEEAAGGAAVRDAVLTEVAHALHDVGIESDDAEAREVGARLRDVGVGAGFASLT